MGEKCQITLLEASDEFCLIGSINLRYNLCKKVHKRKINPLKFVFISSQIQRRSLNLQEILQTF